jgi:hypothetical protein
LTNQEWDHAYLKYPVMIDGEAVPVLIRGQTGFHL